MWYHQLYMIKLSSKEYKEKSKREVVDYILSYLEEQKQMVVRDMSSQEAFTLPSWSEFQAYKLGMLKAFTKVVEFIPDQGLE